ncbi:hypothetical protein DSO57_1008742 [Entomophthora muscae]|uniref:Uncharacterized protein n=1 Tax=Entomophthora muscae TaxID=34485 RepID=A0ACC2TIM0_9FUNG|nr:hypothetical protein DSO57_1008742 [Entomophthora muscae]
MEGMEPPKEQNLPPVKTRILKLSETVANRIAAGEVIQRPGECAQRAVRKFPRCRVNERTGACLGRGAKVATDPR